MTATRLLFLPFLVLGMLLGGYLWLIPIGITALVDVGHKNEWTVRKFAAWLFGLSFLWLVAIILIP